MPHDNDVPDIPEQFRDHLVVPEARTADEALRDLEDRRRAVICATATADRLTRAFFLLMDEITTERQRIAERIMLLDVPLAAATVESRAEQAALREQWLRLNEVAPASQWPRP